MKIQHLATTLILVIAFTATLLIFEGGAQTMEDCQRIYDGTDVMVQACINNLTM